MNQFLEQKSEKALVGDNNSTVVNLENSLIVEILGVNNENLDFCEKKLKVKVLQKGNIVIITGNKKERYIVRNSIILLSRELKDPIKKHQNTFKEILNMQINNDLDNKILKEVKAVIGQLYYFIADNPGDHYQLDLAKKYDRVILEKLLEINELDIMYSKEIEVCKRSDISQYGDYQNFRNVVYNEVR